VELAPGLRLESFVLHHAIGAGGMGAVYLATDTRLERLVALKILPREQARDPETVQRFEQEGRAAARLDHENIARVYALGHDQGYHYIAFEYIEGITLRQQVAEQGHLSVSETIEIALQIAGALVHASERGVVHRDIKPSNIIVTPQGRAKLVDMGLARHFERSAHDRGLTQSGMTLGTFDYISPEQARDPRNVDVRSDLYSLGCSMFQMLTGRPPFPEGTVLQKLLQHQEEPAPDVRTFNPAVPAELSAIVRKLMEKDRERRYQTPQLLRNDLHALAGLLEPAGARPGTAPTASEAWQRHLVWAIPALSLAAVVIALLLSGRPPEPIHPSPKPSAGAAGDLVAREVAPRVTPARKDEAQAKATPVPTKVAKVSAASAPLRREIPVASTEDLTALLARAASGSTLILTDNGPYALRPLEQSAAAIPLEEQNRELTIKADAAVRPVLRGERPRGVQAKGGSALLGFRGGRVHLEGLEFRLEMGEWDEPVAAVFAQDCDVTVTGCVLRRGGAETSEVRASGIELWGQPGRKGGDPLAAPLRVVASSFDRRLVGIRVRGPADIHIRDCSFGPDEPAIWCENPPGEGEHEMRLGMRRSSILTGAAPVFRFVHCVPKVNLENTVVAPATAGEGTLVAIDRPAMLDWRGRENLYGRIGTFLQPTAEGSSMAPIREFEAWSNPPRAIREMRSVSTFEHVWAQDDPQVLLTGADPSRAFQLGRNPMTSSVGVSEGPRGPIAQRRVFLPDLPVLDLRALARAGSRSDDSPGIEASAPLETGGQTKAESVAPMPTFEESSLPMPMDPAGLATRASDAPASSGAGASSETDPRAPMDQMPPTEAVPDTLIPIAGDIGTTSTSSAHSRGLTASSPTGSQGGSARQEGADVSLIHSEAELRRALASATARANPIRISSGATIELDPVSIAPRSRRVLEAEAGQTPPRLILRQQRRDPDGTVALPRALFRVDTGASLELRGIDLVLERPADARHGGVSLFLLGSGTELILSRCTLTLKDDRSDGGLPLALVQVRSLTNTEEEVNLGTATIRVEESMLRADGTLIDVAAGRRVDVSVLNSVLACSGSALRAHGTARGRTVDTMSLSLGQTTARAGGGLVRLVSSPGESELPICDIAARDTILATNSRSDPLFRIEGQESLDELRNRIVWEGRGVAYHLIDTYRLDDSALEGTLPLGFKRLTWEVAVGSREHDSFHGDVRFVTPWSGERRASTTRLLDVRLADDSPVPNAGARLDRIPEPPPVD
jgi:serine/threonine-protein kinase